MCVLWSLETWNRVSGAAQMALNGAVGLALSLLLCVCLSAFVCWISCVCTTSLALLVSTLAYIF